MWEVPRKYGVSFFKSECQVSAFFQKGLKKRNRVHKDSDERRGTFSILWHAFRGRVQHRLTASEPGTINVAVRLVALFVGTERIR
jgi:hypothetical protein